MKHLQFDQPAQPALEGFVETYLKPFFDFFKAKPAPADKINLNHLPYKFQLQGLKDRISKSYGSLDALRGNELVKGPLASSLVSPYLAPDREFTPDPDKVPALIKKALYDITDFFPRLQLVCNRYNQEVVKLLHPYTVGNRNATEASLAQLEDDLKKLTANFKMPPLPDKGLFGNLYINREKIASIEPNDNRLSEAQLVLSAPAKKKGFGHLPVLDKAQIVAFAKVMVDVLTFLENAENYTRVNPVLPSPDDPHIKPLHDIAKAAGHYNEYIWVVLMAQHNHWWLPKRIIHSYEEFLGHTVIAMDRWISRSLK